MKRKPKIGEMKVIKGRHVCRWDGTMWRIVCEAPCLSVPGASSQKGAVGMNRLIKQSELEAIQDKLACLKTLVEEAWQEGFREGSAWASGCKHLEWEESKTRAAVEDAE